MKRQTAIALVLGALSLAGCEHKQVFTEPHVLGQERFAPDILNAGRSAYMLYCYACHGEEGDGRGPAAYAYSPPPRDFTRSTFKFAGVPEGELPTDDELMRIVRDGLTGTAMLPWDISDEELWLAIQYIKTFSQCDEWDESVTDARKCKRGKGWYHARRQPKPVTIPDDPFAVIPRVALWDDVAFAQWAGQQRAAGAEIPADEAGLERYRQQKRDEARARKRAAIELGEKIYHQGGCQLCHPAYVEPERIAAYGGTQRESYPFDPDPKFSKTYGVVLVPPDFLTAPVRSPRRYTDADGNLRYDARDFYRVIASGIPGTAMPSWAALPPERVWAVSYYAADLAEKIDTAEAARLREALLAAPAYTPPPPAEQAAPARAAGDQAPPVQAGEGAAPTTP